MISVLTVPQKEERKEKYRKKHLKGWLEKGGFSLLCPKAAFSWGKGRGKGSKTTGKRHKQHLALAWLELLNRDKTEPWFGGERAQKGTNSLEN